MVPSHKPFPIFQPSAAESIFFNYAVLLVMLHKVINPFTNLWSLLIICLFQHKETDASSLHQVRACPVSNTHLEQEE